MSPKHDITTGVTHLELSNIRVFSGLSLDFKSEGTTAFIGANGAGKTTILEAVHFLSTMRSFRTAQRESMVRAGEERMVIRANVVQGTRELLIETDMDERGKARAQINRQSIRSRSEQIRTTPTTVFSPHELHLLQGGPNERRTLLDDALSIINPQIGARLDDLERILRQRGALLRQAGGRLTDEIASTLDVWDERLAEVGAQVINERAHLTQSLEPLCANVYQLLSEKESSLQLIYQPNVASDELADALKARRSEDIRRGVSTAGPHRDDMAVFLEKRDARLQASQGEQRSLALALRLGVHQLISEATGSAPILLLDDVLSELDDRRSANLFSVLPQGQTLLTSTELPSRSVDLAQVIDVTTLSLPS